MAKDDVSTRFPFINLEKALYRAEQLFKGNKAGTPMAVPVAFELWGYSLKSSGAFQTLAALKGYGLIEDEGANEDRRIRLTEAARLYFLDERDDVRALMLSDFALTPPLLYALWTTDRWSEGLPADAVARSHLKIERKLNDQSARSLLNIFKDNIAFAGLMNVATEPKEAEYAETSIMGNGDEEGLNFYGFPTKINEAHLNAVSIPSSGIDARISGERVIISANVDLKGLRKLKKQIELFERMLLLSEED